MQGAGGNAAAIQFVDLILHQRDERRHDERRAGKHHGRQLVAERLAGAGGHHGEHVASAEDRGNDLLLSRTEFTVAEVRVQPRSAAHHPTRS